MAQTFDSGFARRYEQSKKVLGDPNRRSLQAMLDSSMRNRGTASRGGSGFGHIRDPKLRQSVFLSQTFGKDDFAAMNEWRRLYGVNSGNRSDMSAATVNALKAKHTGSEGFDPVTGKRLEPFAEGAGTPDPAAEFARRRHEDRRGPPDRYRPFADGNQVAGGQPLPTTPPPGTGGVRPDPSTLPPADTAVTQATPTTVNQAGPGAAAVAGTKGGASTTAVNPQGNIPKKDQRHRSQIRSQGTGFSGNRRFHPFSRGGS